MYDIGGGTPENLLDYISTLQTELVRAEVHHREYNFNGHRELVSMQPGDVSSSLNTDKPDWINQLHRTAHREQRATLREQICDTKHANRS